VPVKKLGQIGDTIIEVLLAITVICTMLGGAYVVTNKSLVSSRDAQERSNALKITESQMERLKKLAASNSDAVFGGASPFCIKSDNTVAVAADAGCKVNTSGAPTTSRPQYNLSIARDNATSTFTATTTWEKAHGGGNNSLRISYKVFQ
jgi:Tfp pilus assembly protein PilV